MIRIAIEALEVTASSASEMMKRLHSVDKERVEEYRIDLHAIVNAINMLEIQEYGEIRTKVEDYLNKQK